LQSLNTVYSLLTDPSYFYLLPTQNSYHLANTFFTLVPLTSSELGVCLLSQFTQAAELY
jgi:hypothetical protein